MKPQIAVVTTTQEVWPPEPSFGYDLRSALCALLMNASIDGIETVRLLPSDQRHKNANPKVFFVLKTHDIARDERIVQIMMQFERVDYDLVPAASAGMVPSGAVPVI